MSYKLKSFVVFLKVLPCLLISRSFGNQSNHILVFGEEGKPDYPEKTSSRGNNKLNPHIAPRPESIPGHIGGIELKGGTVITWPSLLP